MSDITLSRQRRTGDLASAFRQKPFTPWIAIVVLALLATMPMFSNPYMVVLFITIFMYLTLCLSWNVFCGPANYVSLGTAAFFGIGVYTSAMFKDLPLPMVMLMAGVLSFALGLVVGTASLRIKGMYFAIFTFGLSEFLRQTMIWYEVNITGTVGRWLPLQDTNTVFYYMLGVFVVTMLFAVLLQRSRWGLALRSIGEAEDAAAHVGINVNMVKILTFAATCFFMAIAGAVLATRWSYIDPDLAFSPMVTFFVVMMTLVGGFRSTIYGPLLGALILTVLSDTVLANFSNLTMLLFGVILIVVIFFLPNGLMSLIQRKKRPAKITESETVVKLAKSLSPDPK